MTLTPSIRARHAALLSDLLTRCESIGAVMLALREGRPYVEKSRSRIDGGKFAAMASSLAALGSSILRELQSGTLDHLLVEGQEGRLVVCTVPATHDLFILAVLADREARLGLVLGHVRMCARAIADEMQC